MLKTADSSQVESVWALVNKLPMNISLKDALFSLSSVTEYAKWSELLDPASTFKFLYCLTIIDEFSSEKEYQSWLAKFIDLGGLTHLIECVGKLQIPTIKSSIEL
jgi:hypothetical protein